MNYSATNVRTHKVNQHTVWSYQLMRDGAQIGLVDKDSYRNPCFFAFFSADEEADFNRHAQETYPDYPSEKALDRRFEDIFDASQNNGSKRVIYRFEQGSTRYFPLSVGIDEALQTLSEPSNASRNPEVWDSSSSKWLSININKE